MAEQVENAVEIALSPSADQALKGQALEFLNQARESPDAWQICLPLFTRSPNRPSDAVRLFSLEVLNLAIQSRFHGMDTQSLEYIRQTLVEYMRTTYVPSAEMADNPAIQNKLTQAMTYLFIATYTSTWPTFFDDLLSLTQAGGEGSRNNLQGVVFFLRMMVSVHDEVADVLVPRTPEQQQRNAVIKDQMRDRDIRKLVPAWQEILQEWKGVNDEVVEMCFKVIGRYVSWIDISLVVNETMLNLVFGHIAAGGKVRDAAIETLEQIIGKKMKGPDKLELLYFLRLGEIVGQIITSALQNQSDSTYDSDLAEGTAKLVNAAGVDLVLILSKDEVDAANRQRAEQLLETFIPYLLRFFEDEYDDVSAAVFPFMLDLLALLRKEKKVTGMLSPARAAMLPSMLRAIVMKTKYDEDDEWGDGDTAADDAEFQNLRKKLKTMQDAVSVIDEKLYVEFLSQVVENTFERVASQGGNGAIDWREVELALNQVHAFGELAIRAGGLFVKGQPNGEAATRLIAMMMKMMSSNIADLPHPALRLGSMEIFVRYAPFFEIHSDLILPALQSFIKGVHDKHPKVQPRAWYLFYKFVKLLRQQIGSVAQTVIEAIADLLVIHAEAPSDNGKDDGDMSDDTDSSEDNTITHQLNLFEAVGCLSSTPTIPVEQQALFVKTIMAPLFEDMSSSLPGAEAGDLKLVMQIHHDMMALGTLGKGFSDWVAGKPQATPSTVVVAEFQKGMEAILVALERLSHHGYIREAARFAFSRMVGVLGVNILPLLPRWIHGLLEKSSTKEEVSTFLKLLDQLVHEFNAQIYDILNSIFSPLLTLVFSSLQEPVSGTDDAIQLAELRREYLNFLLVVVNNDLGQVLVSAENLPNFENIVQTVLVFAKELSDPATERVAFNVLNKLSLVFGPSTPDANKHTGLQKPPAEQPLAGFERFMTERFSLVCWEVPANAEFNMKDAQSKMVLGEIAALQKALYWKLGDAFVEYLGGTLPEMGVQRGVAEYLEALRGLELREFKGFFQKFMVEIGGGR